MWKATDSQADEHGPIPIIVKRSRLDISKYEALERLSLKPHMKLYQIGTVSFSIRPADFF